MLVLWDVWWPNNDGLAIDRNCGRYLPGRKSPSKSNTLKEYQYERLL